MSRELIFERDVMIATRAGQALSANVYRPVVEGTFPVIMTVGPYGKDRHWADRNQQHARDLGGGPFVNWETPDPETWVAKGYVVVRVDNRGTGSSPGFLNPFSRTSAEDYYDAIEWAAEQPWSTGKVGLLGISFYAMNQWTVAALKPPHLTAMIPWEAAADLYRDFTRAGGILNSSFLSWWWPNTVLNVQHGWDGSVSPEERAANRIESLNDEVLERPLDGSFYHDWLSDLANIEVPFLSVGNWGNIGLHLRGNIEAFVNASSEAKWLRIVVGDHIHPFYQPENIALEERFLAHYLKGEDNGWADEPRVMLAIRDGSKTTWRAEPEWPIDRTEWVRMHLDAGELELREGTPTSDAKVSYEAMGDSVTFSSAPFEKETEVTGPVALRLWLASSTADADVFVRLGRIDPNGTDVMGFGPEENQVALTQGWLRASHRKLDDERSLPYRPYHTHDELQPLVPDQPVALDVEIWPTSIVFPVGTRLILEIAGKELSSSHFFHQDERDRPAEVFAGENTVHTGPDHDSYLFLPVIPAVG
jgi:predicted acyl esterase